MIPILLESDAANIEERTTMVVNEQQTINERCNNIVSRGDHEKNTSRFRMVGSSL